MSEILRPTDISEVPIFCDGTLCGSLKRTPRGSSFTYDLSFLALPNKPARGIAHHLQYTDKPILTAGSRLHTFFEGLLPEGHRLAALTANAKTSPDDLFSAFIAAGPDTIGDVYAFNPDLYESTDVYSWDLNQLPNLDFEEIVQGYLAGAKDASISGIQPKVSAARIIQKVRASKTYGPSILKFSSEKYPKIAENEAFFMELAARCGMTVPKFKLVYDDKNRAAILVWRFDRIYSETTKFWGRAHQEDVCQLANKYPAEKYNLSLREVADALISACQSKDLALERLLKLYAYSYVIVNGDLHGKNVSILRKSWNRPITVSPAYDLLSTLPYKDTRMALKMDGKDDEFNRSDFLKFFGRFGLNENVINLTLDTICTQVERNLDRIETIGFDKKVTDHLKREIGNRIARLT